MMMMGNSQLDKSQKNWDPDKRTLLQLEELQRKGNGLGIKFPYLKEMIETLQEEIKPPPSQSLAASNSASEEALYGCLRNIMVLVAKRATHYRISFISCMNLVNDYLQSRVDQMDRYQDSLLSHHVGLLYEMENVLNKRQTLQDERLNELIEKYYPLRLLIGEENGEKPSTAAANSNLEIQDTENEEEEDNEKVGDEISDKTQHSENEGEGEENATYLGIESEEEEDNEEVAEEITIETMHSENEEEGEENATSLEKELQLEKAPQNDADDEDKIAIQEKERILQLKNTFLDLVRMCDDLSLQLASKKEEIKSYQVVRIPPPESVEQGVSMIMDLVLKEKVVGLDDKGFGLIKNLFHAYLKAAIEKVVEFYALQLNTIDNLLNEMSNLVNEKTNVLNQRDSFIDEVNDFINEKEKLENEKLLIPESSLDKITKKRGFGDVTTTANDSPERRTRSHLLFQEDKEIPNTAEHMENEEGK